MSPDMQKDMQLDMHCAPLRQTNCLQVVVRHAGEFI